MSLEITPEQVYQNYYVGLRRDELVNQLTPPLEELFGQEYHIGRIANLFSLLSVGCMEIPQCRVQLEKMQLIILMELTKPGSAGLDSQSVLFLQNTEGLQASVVMETGQGWRVAEREVSDEEALAKVPEFQFLKALIFSQDV